MKINLYGELVSDEWSWLYDAYGIQHFCPKHVREAIEQLPEGEELILEVNSPGGDVWSGFEIFGLIQGCREHTEAHIIALAASAATTVCSACDAVLASPVAQIMIHQPSALVIDYMNNTATAQLQNFLDSVKASIINGYVLKSAGKATRKTFEKLVDQSTYMPVQDAIDLGLVDGLLDTDDELLMSLCASGGVAVKNAAGMSSTPKALLERYEAAVRAGTMEEVPGHPVENAECGMRNAELGAAGGNAECGMRNAELGAAGGNAECGMRNAEFEAAGGNAECGMRNAEFEAASGNAECGMRNADLPEIGGTIKAVYYGESVADGGSRAPALRNEGETSSTASGPPLALSLTPEAAYPEGKAKAEVDWKLKAAIEIERARAGV